MTDYLIIQEAITYIEAEGRVNITSLLKTLNVENNKNIRADKIASQMEKMGIYMIYWLPNDLESILVKRNPSFELNQNIITTNDSVKKLNGKLITFNRLTVIIAAITGVFIAMQFFKDDAPDLQPTNKLLEQTVQQLDSIAKYQKGIDSSLRIMADSISVRKFF